MSRVKSSSSCYGFFSYPCGVVSFWSWLPNNMFRLPRCSPFSLQYFLLHPQHIRKKPTAGATMKQKMAEVTSTAAVAMDSGFSVVVFFIVISWLSSIDWRLYHAKISVLLISDAMCSTLHMTIVLRNVHNFCLNDHINTSSSLFVRLRR